MRRNRVNQSGGDVMILINQGIKYREVEVREDCNGKIEVCAVETFSGGKPFGRVLPSS